MKMGKKFRAIASAALISAMVMSMSGMTTLAAETQTPTVAITKNLEKPENAVAPTTTFTFNVRYVGETSNTVLTEEQISNAGSGVSFKDNINFIESTPSEAQMGLTKITYETKPELEVDLSKYSIPGVYRYQVTETDGGYEGMNYDTDSRYFDVAIGYAYDEDTKAYATNLSVLYARFVNEAGTAKDDANFNNKYGAGDKTGALNNLVVTKKVKGNQVEAGKKYHFTITISNGAADEEYGVLLPNGSKTMTEEGIIGVDLEAGQSVTIVGLSANDKYAVEETNYADQGYTTSYKIVKNDGTTEIDKSAIGNDGKAVHTYTTGVAKSIVKTTENVIEQNTVTFTNEKDVTTPTGIVMTFGPYVLLLALAGVFAVMFLRKKREDF